MADHGRDAYWSMSKSGTVVMGLHSSVVVVVVWAFARSRKFQEEDEEEEEETNARMTKGMSKGLLLVPLLALILLLLVKNFIFGQDDKTVPEGRIE